MISRHDVEVDRASQICLFYKAKGKNSFARFVTETTIFVYLAGDVHTVAKHFISHRGWARTTFEMYKNENFTCKACRTTVSHRKICKFAMFLSEE